MLFKKFSGRYRLPAAIIRYLTVFGQFLFQSTIKCDQTFWDCCPNRIIITAQVLEEEIYRIFLNIKNIGCQDLVKSSGLSYNTNILSRG